LLLLLLVVSHITFHSSFLSFSITTSVVFALDTFDLNAANAAVPQNGSKRGDFAVAVFLLAPSVPKRAQGIL